MEEDQREAPVEELLQFHQEINVLRDRLAKPQAPGLLAACQWKLAEVGSDRQ
jgi:hypothetical protein